MQRSQDIVKVLKEQVRELARDPERRQHSVLAANVPGGTAYLTGLDPDTMSRTLVCCVFDDARQAVPRGRRPAADLAALTPTQTEVAFMLASRLSTREIAKRLGSSTHTVKRHTEQVLLRLHVKRRTEVGPALQRWVTRTLHDSLERCA